MARAGTAIKQMMGVGAEEGKHGKNFESRVFWGISKEKPQGADSPAGQMVGNGWCPSRIPCSGDESQKGIIGPARAGKTRERSEIDRSFFLNWRKNGHTRNKSIIANRC